MILLSNAAYCSLCDLHIDLTYRLWHERVKMSVSKVVPVPIKC